MSRVTIGDLYSDFVTVETPFEDWRKAWSVQVVPRKMVEMIIEECESLKMTNYRYGNYCAGDNLAHIKEYAESLLKQFEEDKDGDI